MYFFANFKLYCSLEKTLLLVQHYAELAERAPAVTFGVMPAVSLMYPALLKARGPLAVGGQICSAHSNGAYTGQVSPQDLRDIGGTFCLIGHSEVRQAYHETDHMVARKALALLHFGIRPIVCVGENQLMSFENAIAYIKKQLDPLIAALNATQLTLLPIIAYEPVWAIGAAEGASLEYISQVSADLHGYTEAQGYVMEIVYGGSVMCSNIQSIWNLARISGVLVGRASTDFQITTKMIELLQ